MRKPVFIVAAAVLLLASAVYADGPGAYRPRDPSPAALSEQSAIDAYNAGYALILRAEHTENLAAAASSDADRQAAQREAQDTYRAALEKFVAAVRFDAAMHEALTYIGYASRKLGLHEDALRAYAQALRINPDYPHAIEYQGQAFLALNRLDDARFNYLRLYALSPRMAGKLLKSMQTWVTANRARPPSGIDFDGFSEWVAQRAVATAGDGAGDTASSW